MNFTPAVTIKGQKTSAYPGVRVDTLDQEITELYNFSKFNRHLSSWTKLRLQLGSNLKQF